jgi:hypothetical protein
MAETFSGNSNWQFLNTDEARRDYELSYNPVLFAGDLHDTLVVDGVARIAMPIPQGDFRALADAYEACLDDAPQALAQTAHRVDGRFGNEAGQYRREPEAVDGIQVQDGKNFFHFNERARHRWNREFRITPATMRHFLDAGAEIHDQLIGVAKRTILALEDTHPNITEAFFPPLVGTCSFLRIISYDPPSATAELDIAKEHRDIGGFTIQADADADGFWAESPSGEQLYYPSEANYAHFFAGQGYENLYQGTGTEIRALKHGVRAVGQTAGKRHAVILFVDAPKIDFGVQPAQTLPQIFKETDTA